MSELSPGSKATTNLFMVLGIAALIALAVSVGIENPGPVAACDERLQQMGDAVWDPSGPVIHPGDTRIVTLEYTVTASATIENIRVISKPSEFDEVAIRALAKARYTQVEENSEPLTCRYSITLPLE
jgi:Gram-negative bacterial TonB protein C-terminal